MARILIVDDSTVMRRNLNLLFTRAGHTVVGEAGNGQQAILLYEKEKPDLVTMDITMPVMDGIDAIRKIINRHPDARIIAISALDQKKQILQAIENGARNYIIKPVTEEKILPAIKAVLINMG